MKYWVAHKEDTCNKAILRKVKLQDFLNTITSESIIKICHCYTEGNEIIFSKENNEPIAILKK